MKRLRTCFLFVLMILSTVGAQAQTVVVRQVIGTGGGEMSGLNLSVRATLAQSAVGTMSGTDRNVGFGFWYIGGGNPVSVEYPSDPLPLRYALSNGTPNPARSALALRYAVPRRSRVSIRLYDISGRCVRTLVEGEQDIGHHSVRIAANDLVSGIYFCRMQAPGFSDTRRLVLLR